MTLNSIQYDENDPDEIVTAASDIAVHLYDNINTTGWLKCLDESARSMRRLAHAMDVMRENVTYKEHK